MRFWRLISLEVIFFKVFTSTVTLHASASVSLSVNMDSSLSYWWSVESSSRDSVEWAEYCGRDLIRKKTSALISLGGTISTQLVLRHPLLSPSFNETNELKKINIYNNLPFIKTLQTPNRDYKLKRSTNFSTNHPSDTDLITRLFLHIIFVFVYVVSWTKIKSILSIKVVQFLKNPPQLQYLFLWSLALRPWISGSPPLDLHSWIPPLDPHPWIPTLGSPPLDPYPWNPTLGSHPWIPTLGSPPLDPHAWIPTLGSPPLDPHPWIPTLGSPLLDPHPWIPTLGFPPLDPHPWIPTLGSPPLDPHPWIPTLGSPPLDPHPWIPTLGSPPLDPHPLTPSIHTWLQFGDVCSQMQPNFHCYHPCNSQLKYSRHKYIFCHRSKQTQLAIKLKIKLFYMNPRIMKSVLWFFHYYFLFVRTQCQQN